MMLCRLKLLADYMSPFGLSIDFFCLLIGLSGVFDLFSNCLLQCFRDAHTMDSYVMEVMLLFT